MSKLYSFFFPSVDVLTHFLLDKVSELFVSKCQEAGRGADAEGNGGKQSPRGGTRRAEHQEEMPGSN